MKKVVIILLSLAVAMTVIFVVSCGEDSDYTTMDEDSGTEEIVDIGQTGDPVLDDAINFVCQFCSRKWGDEIGKDYHIKEVVYEWDEEVEAHAFYFYMEFLPGADYRGVYMVEVRRAPDGPWGVYDWDFSKTEEVEK